MKLYRYHEDDIGEGYGPRIRVRLYAFNVVRTTPKGYWISIPYSFKLKWVSSEAKKRFAYPTKEEALQSFRARKRRQVAILSYQLERAKMALNVSEGDIDEGNLRSYTYSAMFR